MRIIRAILRSLIALLLIFYTYYFMDILWFQRDYITDLLSYTLGLYGLLLIPVIPYILHISILAFSEFRNREFLSISLFWTATPFPIMFCTYLAISLFQLPSIGVTEVVIMALICTILIGLQYYDYKSLKTGNPNLQDDTDILDL